MNEQPASDDVLVRLRTVCDPDDGWSAIVGKRTLLALVECAEALKEIQADMESGWLANHGKEAERNYEDLLAAANAALAKLEKL
jgi:hypothetical protein